MSTLPTSRRFVTQLLDSLPTPAINSADAGTNPLSAVGDTAKKQLLSLQVLFPNEFLPALDLLDRRLVTRHGVGDGEQNTTTDTEITTGVQSNEEVQSEDNKIAQPGDEQMDHTADITISSADHPMTDIPPPEPTTTTPNYQDTIYYVRSAQQRSSRYSASYDTTTSYEVRLRAWNCSCPAFAFAAFPAVHPEPAIHTYDAQDGNGLVMGQTWGQEERVGWSFGGVSLGNAIPPVCKHLLACVLVEKCSGLFGGFVEEKVVSVEEAAGWAAGWGD